jgi:hypothetical protein
MKFRTMAVAGCATLLAAGLTTGTASAAEEIKCSTPVFTSVPVRIDVPGRWAYRYHVSWCVEAGVITAIEPHVTHEVDSSKCLWRGNEEEAETRLPDGSGGWDAFNMAAFSCKNGDGTDGTFNPWGIITVWPNGDSRVLRKGIGAEILN